MPRTFADEIVETSQTVGTGTYDLDGAKGSYRGFRQGYSDGDTPSYYVRNAGNTKWEKNRGGALTYGTPDRLARNVVLSTNGNAAVSWTTADLPLTVYVPRDSDVDEGVITGFLASTRSALLRAGARWWDSTTGLAVSWADTLFNGTDDIRVGLYDAVKALYFPDSRRSSTAVGAGNRIFDADDIGGSFTFNTTAAGRTATLPAGATVKDGYHLELKGLSTAHGVVLSPDDGDGIDGGADGADKTIPGGILFTVRWSAADDQWITNYRSTTLQVAQQRFATSGTYTPTAGMVYCLIEALGAGGGGGGVVSNSANVWASAGGGGAGSLSTKLATAADIGASKTVTVGSGGDGAAAGATEGAAGGDTSVGSLCVGKGGSAGKTNGKGGAGGVSGTGDTTAPGSPGGNGHSVVGSGGGNAGAGNGGSSRYGGGGLGGLAAPGAHEDGANGAGKGAGGGGGASSSSAGGDAAGGDGTDGYVVITEYLQV